MRAVSAGIPVPQLRGAEERRCWQSAEGFGVRGFQRVRDADEQHARLLELSLGLHPKPACFTVAEDFQRNARCAACAEKGRVAPAAVDGDVLHFLPAARRRSGPCIAQRSRQPFRRVYWKLFRKLHQRWTGTKLASAPGVCAQSEIVTRTKSKRLAKRRCMRSPYRCARCWSRGQGVGLSCFERVPGRPCDACGPKSFPSRWASEAESEQ